MFAAQGFLLDKNKKIIGKQIGAEQMGDILGRLEEIERKGIPTKCLNMKTKKAISGPFLDWLSWSRDLSVV